ncbi:MAG: hypothetical protein RL367_856 [Pseudomonadota bacterium]|jgi:hypothetical protein
MNPFLQVLIPWMIAFLVGLLIAWLIWGNDDARRA